MLLSGAVLGARRGFLAVLLYVAAGAAGLPIFAGGASGLAVLQGPTAGYLIGFPLAAGLCGLIVERLPRRAIQTSVPLIFLAGLVSSALFIHTLGMTGLVLRADLTWGQAWDIDKVFWIGDVLKNIAMALVATAVHRAFPDLLAPRRSDRPGGPSRPRDDRLRRGHRLRSRPATATSASSRRPRSSLDERRVALIGANGSGKSTLARLVNGLVEATTGRVLVDGLDPSRDGREVRRRVGFVFTDPAAQLVMPTAAEDVALSLRRTLATRPNAGGLPSTCSDEAGLGGLGDRSVHALSGGQRQLLALAGVLARLRRSWSPTSRPPCSTWPTPGGSPTCCSGSTSSWCWSPTTSTWPRAATGRCRDRRRAGRVRRAGGRGGRPLPGLA